MVGPGTVLGKATARNPKSEGRSEVAKQTEEAASINVFSGSARDHDLFIGRRKKE